MRAADAGAWGNARGGFELGRRRSRASADIETIPESQKPKPESPKAVPRISAASSQNLRNQPPESQKAGPQNLRNQPQESQKAAPTISETSPNNSQKLAPRISETKHPKSQKPYPTTTTTTTTK